MAKAFEKIPQPPSPFQTPTRRRQVYIKEDKMSELESRLQQVEAEREELKKRLEEVEQEKTKLSERFEELSKRLLEAETAVVQIARELRRRGLKI